MRYFFLLAMLLAALSGSYAQKVNTDSLEQVLNKKNLTEAEELITVSALGKALRKTDAQRASAYLFKALALSEKLNDSAKQANARQVLGNILLDKGQYEQATQFYFAAMKYFAQKHDTVGMIKVNQGLGQCFDLLKNYKNAIRYFTEALNMALAFGKKSLIMPCYVNLGVAFQESGDNERALQNYEKCRVLLEQLDMKEGRFVLYNNISVVLEKQGRRKEALDYAHRSYALLDGTENPVNVSKASLNLGEVFLKLGVIDSARYWLHKGLVIGEKYHYPEQVMNGNRLLADLYAQRKDYPAAYQHQQKYMQAKDSLFDQREVSVIQQLHEGYQLGKKEEEISSLKTTQEKLELDLKVNRLVTTLMIVITASVLIIALVVTYSYLRKRRLAAALDNQNREIQRLNQVLEIKALRSQMDPHFVFNALNGLQHFLTVNSAEASIEYLSKVARLIRLTLQNASRDWVKLKEEMEILRLYLQIEQYRFPDKFAFDFVIDPEVENEKIPFLVIQPYVENAVLHGLIPRTAGGGRLTIRARKETSVLVVEVEDNGVGRGNTIRTADPMFTSMGSGLVKERLKKLSLQLGVLMDAQVLDLKDDNGIAAGTKSILSFEMQGSLKSVVAA
jgi:tetratricopeptide (TPR) repeat protein